MQRVIPAQPAQPTPFPRDVTQTGAQNVPVPANQIIELPEITATKQIDRDGNGTFEDIADAGEFCFKLDGGTCIATDANGQVVFQNVTPDGAHTVTEQQLVFSQGTYAFDSGTGTNCTFSGATATATVAAGTTGTNASCTFRNKAQNGTIELKKHWVGGAGNATLKIGSSAGGNEVASTTLVGADGTTPQKQVNAGTYYVNEVFNSPTSSSDYETVLACFNDLNNNGTKEERAVCLGRREQRGRGQCERSCRLHLHQHPPAGLDRAEEDLGRDGGPDDAADRHLGRRHPDRQPADRGRRRSAAQHRRQGGRHRHLLRLRDGRARQL